MKNIVVAVRLWRRGQAWVLPILLMASVTMPSSEGEPTAAASTALYSTEGQRVFVCGHSFHVYIHQSLPKLAGEAGIKHQAVGVQMLGASEVHQHWDLARGNKVKPALSAGLVDVLTLSPAWRMPDKAIDLFVELGLSKNPNLRVILQQSWSGYDGAEPPARIKDNSERDRKTVADLKPRLDAQRAIFEKQAQEINDKYKKQVVFVAPAAQAVLALREKITKGEAPGLERQSQLFRDALGHGLAPVQNLVSYVFFACIYHRSPIGMKTFKKQGDDAWNRLDDLLQQIAWDTVLAHPFSGVKGDASPTKSGGQSP